MRYFKYSGEIPNMEIVQKRGRELSAAAQRQRRRENLLHKLGTVVFWTVFLSLSAGLIFLINWMLPEDGGVILVILSAVVGIVFVFVAIIISAIIGAIAAIPLWGRQKTTEKAMLRQALNESCAALRQFYQFQEPYLVTKCYCSSDRRFDRHDVCIYMVEDELRITVNLHYGFFDPQRDLGCYCMEPQEIRLSETRYKDRPAMELTAEGVSFVLGIKAKLFVEEYVVS